MYVTCRASGLDGVWNEQLKDDRSFVTAIRNVARASVLMMQEIRKVQPEVIFINSESTKSRSRKGLSSRAIVRAGAKTLKPLFAPAH